MKIYARPDHPTWFVGGGVDETGQYLFVRTAKGTDKNEVYVADLGDPLKPNVQAPIVPVVTGHDANYFPLGVVQRQALSADGPGCAEPQDRGSAHRDAGSRPLARCRSRGKDRDPELGAGRRTARRS